MFEYLKGRHTAFAAFFAVIGVILQWFHRLDATFVAYMTSLMGMVLGHSMQENHFNVNTNITDVQKDVTKDVKIDPPKTS